MTSEKYYRIAEIFGPTIQGEGKHAGVPCHFVRFGGCDSRCVWCDSPHAVLPGLVAQLPKMSEYEIAQAVESLPVKARWVVLSGGNPALHDLTNLVAYLSGAGHSVMVETQGTYWNDWLLNVDELCISPKPPSSKNSLSLPKLAEFLSRARPAYSQSQYLKVVVFDERDYDYAKRVHQTNSNLEMHLSVGHLDPTMPTVENPVPTSSIAMWAGPNESLDCARDSVLQKMAWLYERVANDVDMRDVRVLPQLHVLAWGNQRGR